MKELIEPKSIAVIGASRDKSSVGYGIFRNLLSGCPDKFQCVYCKGFKGRIYPVNPKAKQILGKKCYAHVNQIEDDIDLAIIAVPARIVNFVVQECIEKKVKAIIVISAGFSEFSAEGKKLQEELVKMVKAAGIKMIGPNCLGIINPHYHMNASFAPAMPPKGGITFISQSGALADSVIDWSIEERYGFRAIVTYGNKGDLNETDFLKYFGKDKETKAIAMYIEGIDDGRRFMEVARKIKKPIVVLKSGRSEKGRKAVGSHTGSLAGSYDVYKAAFKQCGVHVADTVEELFDLAMTLAHNPKCGKNVAIVTNAGGPGVLCSDFCEEAGLNVVELKKSTLHRLDKSGKMHAAYSRHNPLDLVGDALPERYEVALNTLLAENYVDAAIVIQTLQTMTDPVKDAEVVVKARKRFGKPILCTYMGGMFSDKGVKILQDNNIPDFNCLKKAVKTLKALTERS